MIYGPEGPVYHTVKCPMDQRAIITLMHKLHHGNIDTSDGYAHVLVDDKLDRGKFEQFIRRYIEQEKMLVYVNSQNAHHCGLEEAYFLVQENLSENRIRIASEDFNAKIIIESTGVGIGHLTRP